MMTISNLIEKAEWENFLLKFERRTFLSSWNWGSFREDLGDKIWRRSILRDGKIEALFLVTKVESKKGDFLLLSHSPTSLNIGCFRKAMDEVHSIAKKEKVSFIRMAPIFEAETLEDRLLDELGYKESSSSVYPTKSLELDLSISDDLILSKMRKSTRYLIRKSIEDSDIHITISSDISSLDEFYKIHQETALRHGFNHFSYDYFKKELDTFSKDDQAVILLGWRKNKCIAAAFIVFWGGKAFYHHGASIYDSSKTSVPHLLQWEVIKEAKKRGCSSYNLWAIASSNDPKDRWAGLTLFKKGFGGKEINYAKTRDLPLSKKYWLTYCYEKIRR